MPTTLLWGGFILLIISLLFFDLKVMGRRVHEVTLKESLLWVLFWVSLALIFNAGIFYFRGTTPALEFITGYLIEYSLSVDNIFVFILIFTYFGVPPQYRHKVLFWGILGAIVMRMIFILVGVALIQKLHWIIYVFGAFLVYIGIKLALEKDKEIHPEKNPVIKLYRRFFPVTEGFVGGNFFIKKSGKIIATPLFVCVLVVETSDIIFAVDSIPAILSITYDPFIVYTSNIFAILGLRSLYFAIASLMPLFYYLNYGLSFILVFVGVKMLIADFYKIPVAAALGVVAGVLIISIALSVLFPKKEETAKS